MAPFHGRCGAFLTRLLGADYRSLFDEANLLDTWPGPSGKGSAAPRLDLRLAWDAFLLADRHQAVVLCGKRVAGAAGLRMGFLGRLGAQGRTLLLVPHPSGVCRWWNDPGCREAARRFLLEAVSPTRSR